MLAGGRKSPGRTKLPEEELLDSGKFGGLINDEKMARLSFRSSLEFVIRLSAEKIKFIK